MTTYRARAGALASTTLVTLLVAGCGSSSTPASSAGPIAPGASVNTALLSYTPETAHIKTGQTVTWIGGDNITHVLVEGTYQVGSDGLRTTQTDDKAFHLSLTKKGQRVSHVYDTAGTFTYYCSIHHGMNGTVVVS